jgi:hypothetical protein
LGRTDMRDIVNLAMAPDNLYAGTNHDPNAHMPPRPNDSDPALEGAIKRILSEVDAGLRHGYFEYTLSCELTSSGKRRLTLHAGKNYQFLIPADAFESGVLRPH